MGKQKTCGKCGLTGHNARTCSRNEPVPSLNIPRILSRSGIKGKFQCKVCREYGHNRKTCPVQKSWDSREQEQRVQRRKIMKDIFLELGLGPGALVNVTCNMSRRNLAPGKSYEPIQVPAIVTDLVVRYSLDKKDKSTLDWQLKVQKFGNQDSYPGIADYYYFGKEDNSQVSLPREVLNMYGVRTNVDDLDAYSSVTMLSPLIGCDTFNQFYDDEWMAGNEKL